MTPVPDAAASSRSGAAAASSRSGAGAASPHSGAGAAFAQSGAAATPRSPLRPGTGACRTLHQLGAGGAIRDWLVTPVAAAPVDLAAVVDATGSPWESLDPDLLPRWRLTNGPDSAPVKEALYRRIPLSTTQAPPPAVEGAPASWTLPTGGCAQGTWRRVHASDGYVDFSVFSPTPQLQFALAACALEVDQAEWRELEVASTGPVALWIAGRLVTVTEGFTAMEPQVTRVRVRLESGSTPVAIATWQLAMRECRHIVALRVLGLPCQVALASPGANEAASLWAEGVLEAVGLAAWATHGHAELTGPPGAWLQVSVDDVRVHGTGGDRPAHVADRAFVELDAQGRGRVELPRLTARGGPQPTHLPYEATVSVAVAQANCPQLRQFAVANLAGTQYRSVPEGDAAQWRGELLEYAANQPPSLARALAAHALGRTDPLTSADAASSLNLIAQRGDCADFEAVALLIARYRLPADAWALGLRDQVDHAILGFKYWIDQPGLDVMCYFTENHQLVWHTAEILAGQAFPDATFATTGWTGAQHAQHGRTMATQWLARKLRDGFSEFNSNAYVAINCLALAALHELADDPSIRRAAQAALDLTVVSLAESSWRGIHGSAHGRSYEAMLRSARLEETGPLMWALWGAGSLNPALLPAVVLATSPTYRAPGAAQHIALPWSPGAQPASTGAWESRQVQAGTYHRELDLLTRPYYSDVRTYRTPSGMVSSVQDYRPGLPGLQEHVWGITLSPEVQIYATHPSAGAGAREARPGAWCGQRVLPRVRQRGPVILALHRIPDADPYPRTHLWFPAAYLDELEQCGPWLAGRLGEAYVAVATAGGFQPAQAGPESGSRWVPCGPGLGYVALASDAGAHLSLTAFVDVLNEPRFGVGPSGEAQVSWRSPAGELLELGWDGPLWVDGLPVSDDPHVRIDSPACHLRFGDPEAQVAAGDATARIDLASWRDDA